MRRRVLKSGRSLLMVTQTEQVWSGIRERRIQWRLEPLSASDGGGGERPEKQTSDG